MPITPRLMVLLAEAPELCLAKAGRTAGRIAADPAAFRKRRRLNERSCNGCSPRESCDMVHLNITFHHGAATAHGLLRRMWEHSCVSISAGKRQQVGCLVSL